MRWFEEYRMGWITEMLQVYGYINRRHLQRKFGVSAAQAATDFRNYERRFPGTFTYSKSRKRYEIVPENQPWPKDV